MPDLSVEVNRHGMVVPEPSTDFPPLKSDRVDAIIDADDICHYRNAAS